MDNRGFIKINRNILNWEWYDDTNTKVVFLHLLLSANYKPTKYRGFDIPVGGLVAGHSSLASQTTLSIKQVRTALKKLEKTGSVAIKRTSKFSIITMVNWSQYQERGQASDNQGASRGQAEGKRGAASKEGKKGRKEEVKNKRTKNAKINFASFPSEPDEKLLQDWFKVRKAKRLVNTQIAIDAVGKEITKAVDAGYSVDQCLRKMIERSWGSFELDWMKKAVEIKAVQTPMYEYL